MNIKEILHVAWEGIASNRIRSFLTMLGVIIGVAAVIIMVAISAGTEATIADQIETLGTNLLFVTPGNISSGGTSISSGNPGAFRSESNSLVLDDALAIADLSGVTGVTSERDTSETVKNGSIILDSISIVGTTVDYFSIRGIELAEGRFLTDSDIDNNIPAAVLGSSLATDLFGEDDPVGQQIMIGDYRFTVVGVAEEKGTVGNTDYDNRVYLPITVVFDKFTPSMFARIAGDTISSITVQVENPDNMDAIILQIKLLLASRYDSTVDELPFTVNTQQDIIDTRAATTAAFRSLLGWVAAVSLVVGGIGIMNIMLVSVTERTREIGIRQSVGATPRDIRLQFLVEAVLLSLSGGLIGVLFGIGGSWISNITDTMRTVVKPESILLAFTSAALIGVFFGYYPAKTASELDPIEALRHE
jgi:putative ABC transport system permease protein